MLQVWFNWLSGLMGKEWIFALLNLTGVVKSKIFVVTSSTVIIFRELFFFGGGGGGGQGIMVGSLTTLDDQSLVVLNTGVASLQGEC